MKKILIIGAGPAGLTAAHELLSRSKEYQVTILEQSGCIGGISRTVVHNGNRMDIGGHRFFSKDPKINRWWEKRMPVQGVPARDDRLLNRKVETVPGGPDPESEDRVMLNRQRVSRIYFQNRFYDYPIRLKPETLRNMGVSTTVQVGLSYLAAVIHKLPEDNLENFYINRFGRKLYSMFFEYYTENLWGRHPREIDASWGAQRVKGLSISAVLRDMWGSVFSGKNREVETSLIEQFKYPKLGPGQLWEVTASEIEHMGGQIIRDATVIRLHKSEENRIEGLTYRKGDKEIRVDGDYVISSMPLKDLVQGLNDVPGEVGEIARGLPYRDYISIGVLVPKLALRNHTRQKTVGNIIPDCWIYVQDRQVKMGRFQIYNNWSPYLVQDLEHTVWLGLEYFANEGDSLWELSDDAFTQMAIGEMVQLGLITDTDMVLDTHMERVPKAYPAYFDTYGQIDKLISYLNGIKNLYCVGRNGQHRYNNMDHSMLTAFRAADCILTGSVNKEEIWNVNTEKAYHEA
ncbi:MAG: NAD(P)/FAD-dependent oxidoreductase [Faecousia sp.]